MAIGKHYKSGLFALSGMLIVKHLPVESLNFFKTLLQYIKQMKEEWR